MHDSRPGRGDEGVGTLDPGGQGFCDRRQLSRCRRRQAIDLVGVEDGVGTQHGNARHRLVAGWRIIFGPFDGFGVDHGCAVLALPDLPAEDLGLTVGHPSRRYVAALNRLGPENQNIDAAIGCAIVAKRPD